MLYSNCDDGMEESLRALLTNQQVFFLSGATHDEAFRRRQLVLLRRGLVEESQVLADALRADLGKPEFEIITGEIGFLIEEIDRTLRRLRAWCQPVRVRTPLWLWPGKSEVLRAPHGPVLIISPWNQPLLLAMLPVIGAIAGGNTAILKPSEFAPRTAEAIQDLINRRFTPESFRVVTGDAALASALASLPFSYLFFTGGVELGRRVYQSAAANLCPVTLELGGKNPCVVRQDANLRVAAQRIVRGKFLNAGQSCVAPDTVFVHASVEKPLLAELSAAIERCYGRVPADSPDYGRIVNDRHFARLSRLLANTEVYYGGQTSVAERYFAPTLVRGVAEDSPLASEEIFGPILPVVGYSDEQALQQRLLRSPTPLALYIFTEDRKAAQALRRQNPAGGVVINDTVSQVMNPSLPFGGVGTSGMGSYRSDESWRTFTRPVALLDRSTRLDPAFHYPPYSPRVIAAVRRRLARRAPP
jgi:aldehyde dehydrogenase (NAD+)